MEDILTIKGLSVTFHTLQGEIYAIRNLSLNLKKGEVLAIVGESGCGKSVLCKSIIGLLPRIAVIEADSFLLNGISLKDLSEKQYTKIRGKEAAMIFQNHTSSFNPVKKIGKQITEAILIHEKIKKEAAKQKTIKFMELVGIENPEEKYNQYPASLSGGMQQRCMIALTLACNPKLVLADEITTALDRINQKKVIKLLLDLKKKLNFSMLFINHNFHIVENIADRIAVMYAGKIIEIGKTKEILEDARHPYTKALLEAMPDKKEPKEFLENIEGNPPDLKSPIIGDAFAVRNSYALAIDYQEEPPMFSITDTHFAASWLLDKRAPKIDFSISKPTLKKEKEPIVLKKEKIIEVCHLKKHFINNKGNQKIVLDNINFYLQKGEIFGLVGESGSGKTTIAKCILRMLKPASGEIKFHQFLLTDDKTFYQNRNYIFQNIQMIFQDPFVSFNPKKTIAQSIMEPLIIQKKKLSKKEREYLVKEMLETVGLKESYVNCYPSELSGGQRQRAAIARALILNPECIIADEPIASLDVSIQAQIINLFQKLQKERGFTFLFISHDLDMIKHLSDRIGVLYQGKLIEVGKTEEVFSNPQQAYTRKLFQEN